VRKKQFFVVTADHSGLPLALRLKDEGYPVTLLLVRPELADGRPKQPKDAKEREAFQKKRDYLQKNGSGLVPKAWLDKAWSAIARLDKNLTYVIFDQIYGWQFGEALRRQGFKVLGGTKLGYELETERNKTLRLYASLDLDVPLQKEFGPRSAQKGIEFLKQQGDKMLFVFKSDNPKVVTQVAYESNEELIQKIEAERKDIDADGFILQQKVEGIELAVEEWLYEEKPVFANVDLEAKKKYNEMSEVQTGCSFQITVPISISHPLRQYTLGLMDKLARKIRFGFLDISVIYVPQEDKFYALEQCGNRPAYNSFYTILALCKISVGELLSAYMDGEFPDGAFDTQQTGVSQRVFNDDKTPDQRIDFPVELRKNVWLWDVYEKDGDLYTTGDEAVGILTAVGENPESAFAKVREYFHKFHMPTKWARDDFDEEDEPGLPLYRYHALKKLNLL
jgi:hypothetical protein